MVQVQWKQEEESSFSILHNSVEVVVDSQAPDSRRRTLSTARDVTKRIRPLRLSVLGAKSVGKTAIIVRYLTRRFIGEYRSQVDISYRHIVSIGNKETLVDIFDFSPKNEEVLMPQTEVSSSDCFLVVFNIADRVTFLKAVNVVSVLRSLPSAQTTPLTLLGNKRDLEHARQVSMEELQNISSLLKCDYSEVSAAESREEIVPIIFNLLKRVLSPPPLNPNMLFSQNIAVPFKVSSNSEPCLCQDSPESHLQEEFQPQELKKNLHSKKLSVPEMEIEQYIVGCGRNYENENQHPSTTQNSCNFSSEKSTQRTASFVRGSSPCSTLGGKSNELPLKKIRVSHHPPIARTKSLQGKERRGKADSKSKSKKVSTLNFLPIPDQCSVTDQRVSCEVKKDSKISSFLNCSKSSGDQETCSYSLGATPGRDAAQKGESGAIASLFLRGRSFTHEDSLSSFCSSPEKKTMTTRSRKTLPSRFLNDSEVKSNELKKHSHPLLDSPKPPASPHKRDVKSLQDHQPPIAKPAFGDFSTAKSYTTLDEMFQEKQTFTDEAPEQVQCKAPEKRERKFGVFGKGVLGSVFSKTSLPDLPRATASFYTKIGSIKKTIQKRSI